MNETVNKFLLVGEKFMPKMHLKQLDLKYSALTLFTKNKERIEKLMQAGNTEYIYKNDLDKACFQHDMAYDKFKDLSKRTQSDKFLRDKAFEIASNPKYDGYWRGLASMVYKCFDKKKLLEEVLKIKLKKINNLQMNFINQLLENFKKEKFIHHLNDE